MTLILLAVYFQKLMTNKKNYIILVDAVYVKPVLLYHNDNLF